MSTTNPPDVGEQSTGSPRWGACRAAASTPGSANLVLLGIIDVLGLWAVLKAYGASWWLAVGFLTIVLVIANVTYFRKGGLPLKYMLPGLVFLVAFQLYPAGYTFYASFTNLGTGHLISQEEARASILVQNEKPVADAPSFDVRPIVKGNEVSMLITDPGDRHRADRHVGGHNAGPGCRVHRCHRDRGARLRHPSTWVS